MQGSPPHDTSRASDLTLRWTTTPPRLIVDLDGSHLDLLGPAFASAVERLERLAGLGVIGPDGKPTSPEALANLSETFHALAKRFAEVG